MTGTSRRQARARSGSGSNTNTGRGASWLRNNWTETETREVMEILVDEFIRSDYATAAYSKSHAPDARFKDVSFSRPPRELYNKVQNLRQRFFTPHSYLLRWAGPQADARVHKRAEKCLMNPKTRDSIHGIFTGEVPEALRRMAGRGEHDERGEGISVKSVNFYCDIFRLKAPDTWQASVEAYKLFLANRDLQTAVAAPFDAGDGQSDSDMRIHSGRSNMQGLGILGSPPLSLSGSAQATPLLTDAGAAMFGTDFGTDVSSDQASDDGSELQLVAVVGHSWHRFLTQSKRWQTLGLHYTGKDDWEQQEVMFLVQHLLTLADYSVGAHSELPLSIVPMFAGTFDAANIEMAVNRAQHVRAVRLATLCEDLRSSLKFVDTRDPFTMLSLCWLTDRATRTRASLALLVSHGSHGQRFGLFPHNDSMYARLVAGSDNMWYRYHALAQQDGLGPHNRMQQGRLGHEMALPGLMSLGMSLPVPPTPDQSDDEPANTAFAYAQSGFKYTFCSRRKGHFFEMARDEEWVPTMMPSRPRSVWAPEPIARDALLAQLHQDNEKLLAAMVELFGLRLFCFGYFDAMSSAGGSRTNALPASTRRISDDSTFASRRRRNPSLRAHRNRISTGALPSLSGNVSSGSNGSPYTGSLGSILPYRRPMQGAAWTGTGPAPPRTASTPHISVTGGLSANMLPFLSPQAPSHHSFPPADIAAISASLPNSPFFGFPLDNNLGQQQHQQHQQLLSGHNSTPHDAAQLFPSLSDTAFAAAAAAVTTSASSSSLTAGLLHDSLASVASAAMAVAAASSRPALSDDMLGVNMYPGPALSSALASLGGVHVSPDVATPSPAARTEAASDSTLFPGVVSSGVYMQGASALASSPAFWDMSGSLGVPIGSVTSASIQSPDTQLHDAMGSASSDAVAAAVAAMGLASSTENNGAVSVAIYPPPATNVSTLPAWDDMAAANSLSTVLGSPEMLMHIVQPSPPQAHYNLSAQATPAFDSLGAPLPNGLSPVQNQQQQLGELHMQTTPGTAASSGFASMADDGQSSMAAYFGTAVSIGPMSSSQETVVATSQPMLDQLKLFAVPPPQSMDVDLPTTSCPGY